MAFKCDVCGRCYEFYEGIKSTIPSRTINALFNEIKFCRHDRSGNEPYYVAERFQLCPDCMDEIMTWAKIKEMDSEKDNVFHVLTYEDIFKEATNAYKFLIPMDYRPYGPNKIIIWDEYYSTYIYDHDTKLLTPHEEEEHDS